MQYRNYIRIFIIFSSIQILICCVKEVFVKGQQCEVETVSQRESILFHDGYYGSGWSDYDNSYQDPGADKVNGYVKLKGLDNVILFILCFGNVIMI